MVQFDVLALLMIPLYFAIPAIILYFVIKLAVKNAMKEINGLKEGKTL